MLRSLILLSISLPLILNGCSYISEKRISNLKERCALIGFPVGTEDNSRCVLELESARLENLNYFDFENSKHPVTEGDVQRMIDQDRIEKQILRHGAGGCTPNFATGGCL